MNRRQLAQVLVTATINPKLPKQPKMLKPRKKKQRFLLLIYFGVKLVRMAFTNFIVGVRWVRFSYRLSVYLEWCKCSLSGKLSMSKYSQEMIKDCSILLQLLLLEKHSHKERDSESAESPQCWLSVELVRWCHCYFSFLFAQVLKVRVSCDSLCKPLMSHLQLSVKAENPGNFLTYYFLILLGYLERPSLLC